MHLFGHNLDHDYYFEVARAWHFDSRRYAITPVSSPTLTFTLGLFQYCP